MNIYDTSRQNGLDEKYRDFYDFAKDRMSEKDLNDRLKKFAKILIQLNNREKDLIEYREQFIGCVDNGEIEKNILGLWLKKVIRQEENLTQEEIRFYKELRQFEEREENGEYEKIIDEYDRKFMLRFKNLDE